MSKVYLSLNDIIQMTQQVGDSWAVAHARRLIELVKQIGRDLPYDAYIIELAAYLHDWGAFPAYAQKDVEHAVRSRQVVEVDILPRLDLTADQKAVLLETIELHDYRDLRSTQSNESLLLREADMLEFLGMIGMARDFARGPRNVEACYKRILGRQADIRGRFTLQRAQEIAQIRLERMDQCLRWLEGESFGVL
jgi:HD superfamily phosphodiesterase